MKLQTKALILFSVFILCLLALSSFQWNVQDKHNADVSKASASYVEASFHGKLDEFRDSMISTVSRLSNDYSYQQLSNSMLEASIEIATIDSYLKGSKLDFLFMIDVEGNVPLAREYDFYRNKTQPYRDKSKTLMWEIYGQLPVEGNLNFGVLQVGADPVYVAIKPVVDNQSGNVAYLVAGSYLSTLLAHIQGTLNLNVETVYDSNKLQGYGSEVVSVSVEALLGKPLILALQKGDATAISPLSATPFWGLWAALIVMMSAGFWQFIYRPGVEEIGRILDQLDSIQMQQGYSNRIDVDGHSAFSHLATRINSVLSTLEYAYNVVIKNSEVTSGLINEVKTQRELSHQNVGGTVFAADVPVRVKERMHMVSLLSRAIETQNFSVAFQPQYATIGQEISTLTALIRWEDEVLGKVPPCQFLALAEDSGLMNPLSEILIKKACLQAKVWQNEGFKPIPVACKLSSSQFTNKRLLASVVAALAASKLEPRFLELEITEKVLMENIEQSIETLTTLSQIGINLVVDDFVGQCGLNNLKLLPIGKIKLDSRFVAEVAENKKDASLIEGVVKLGNSLGLTVIAAGIETESQLKALQSKSGNVGLQGDFVGRPLSSKDIAHYLPRFSVTRLKAVS
ncbi:MAG: EAL domain-containing protein [Pseudomonadales bacterium]|nr:EAL domain-containing protein [Pseudomonadales bacterium]